MRILVVEDDRSFAANLQLAIESAGFECDVAHDGAVAVEQVADGEYDLVVLDIMLPGLNGFQVCAELRQRELSVPILMLTAKAGEWDEAESLDTGADDYLTKPVSMIVLMAHVRALLRRSQLFPSSQLAFDGVTLDPVKRVCRYGRTQVQLSGREVEVLAALMAAEGSVIPKSDLVARVWGDDFQGDRNIAEVYVRHLRKKLERPLGRQVVTTVHGVGYRFCIRGEH